MTMFLEKYEQCPDCNAISPAEGWFYDGQTCSGCHYPRKIGRPSLAILDAATERLRQQAVEGWTLEHDDAYFPGTLAQAGACYAMNAGAAFFANRPPSGWPFDRSWWKPTTPRRDLVKAAALILAEIERLDRAEGAGK